MQPHPLRAEGAAHTILMLTRQMSIRMVSSGISRHSSFQPLFACREIANRYRIGDLFDIQQLAYQVI